MSDLLFADDFVGLAEAGLALEKLIDNVHNYGKSWRSEANVKKCAVVIISKAGKVLGEWVWDDEILLVLDSYYYLAIDFT